jgi:hypothetical protein
MRAELEKCVGLNASIENLFRIEAVMGASKWSSDWFRSAEEVN